MAARKLEKEIKKGLDDANNMCQAQAVDDVRTCLVKSENK